jgi:hypothetical protein
MSLCTAAISNFEPDKIFDLVPAHADDFVDALEEYSQIFGYNGSIARVPTECDIDPTDPNNITIRKKVDILTTWQTITDENVQKCATMLWGEKQWAITANADKELRQPSFGRGEVTLGGESPHSCWQSFNPQTVPLYHSRFSSHEDDWPKRTQGGKSPS